MTALRLDGVGHGLADLQVVEGRLAGVEVELHDGRRHLVALRGGLDGGQLGQGLHVAPGDRGEAADVGLALLHGRGAGGRVGDEAGDDAIEVGPPRLPVVGVAVEPDELAALPLHELEGPGADRRVGVLARLDVGALVQVLRQHRRLVARKRHQQVGRRPGEPEDGRVRVRRVDLGDLAEGRRPARVRLLEHLEHGELHVGAREGLAVVELDALLEREGDGLAVGAHLPGFREPGDGLEVQSYSRSPS